MKPETIEKLQYITQDFPLLSHTAQAEIACKAGVKWVQLRVKDKPEEEIRKEALNVREICHRYQAIFILNDHVSLAKEVKADGVHLGKQDMPPEVARQILGDDFITGGTANTFEDILKLAKSRVDYIGLGPFRFTETKKDLSPILGREGYVRLMDQCKENLIELPVIAIGGIHTEDIYSLMQTGIHGIAVSSAITRAEQPEEEAKRMIDILYKPHNK